MHEFKHPKYYTELRKRNKSDQAISSCSNSTELAQRAPGQGLKQQATSSKRQAPSESSTKLQQKRITGVKLQATSIKLQATSNKLQDS